MKPLRRARYAADVAFGPRLRSWRAARRLSQAALATRAAISPRHLSFVENGRANPSRDVVLALCDALDVPLRERNELLAAAGFAAGFTASTLAADTHRQLRRALDHVLAQQEPFGAIIVDARWNLVEANRGATRMLAQFPPRSAAGLEAARNLVLATLHPDALRGYVVNWDEVAGAVMTRLHHEVAATPHDEARARLLATALATPGVPTSWRARPPGRTADPFLTVHLRSETLDVRVFSMITTIGTPLDVTVEELRIESFFPADAASEHALRALAAT